MLSELDMKNVIEHLISGSLGDQLCLICLSPLKDKTSESIFTLICKEGDKYCVANALETMCQIKLDSTENYNVCMECFKSATSAYKFHLQAVRSWEILSFYTNELLNNINNVDITDQDTEKLLFIPLISYKSKIKQFDIEGTGIKEAEKDKDVKYEGKDNLILVVDNEKTSYFEIDSAGILKSVETDNKSSDEDDEVVVLDVKKERKKRDPMMHLSCSRCPVSYRFISKLKKHMKTIHDVDIYFCKICKVISENKEDYEIHIKSHKGEHQCSVCNTIYKKAENLVAHMKMHERNNADTQATENSNICEVCGAVLPDEEALQQHVTDRHVKKFTCHYCGRMYKGEVSLDRHVRKHELHMAKVNGTNRATDAAVHNKKANRSVCQTCGKDFVDERALMWHQRLHDDDRPYSCEVCGRRFVSAARRNQHRSCKHAKPRRRCPLCPRLFHLTSMVNTHLKRVHLSAGGRRRAAASEAASWRTAPVPLQELSVDVQARLLDYTSRNQNIFPSSPSIDVFSQSQAA